MDPTEFTPIRDILTSISPELKLNPAMSSFNCDMISRFSDSYKERLTGSEQKRILFHTHDDKYMDSYALYDSK